jgi:hypothetical protein
MSKYKKKLNKYYMELDSMMECEWMRMIGMLLESSPSGLFFIEIKNWILIQIERYCEKAKLSKVKQNVYRLFFQ